MSSDATGIFPRENMPDKLSHHSFQNDNFGKGGKGNDRVTVSVQDSAGTNNADFSTPAEYVLLWGFLRIYADVVDPTV